MQSLGKVQSRRQNAGLHASTCEMWYCIILSTEPIVGDRHALRLVVLCI